MAGINFSSSMAGKKNEKLRLFDSSFLITFIIFLLVLVLFGGLRFYIKTLETKNTELSRVLTESTAVLQGPAVDRVAAFENRLTLIAAQADSPTVDSQKLLSQLESLVVPSVRLTQYEYNAMDKTVEVAGEAESFKNVAQQIISFKSEALFSGVKVETLTLTEEGRVAFALKAAF